MGQMVVASAPPAQGRVPLITADAVRGGDVSGEDYPS
jgi:hypothetical protein